MQRQKTDSHEIHKVQMTFSQYVPKIQALYNQKFTVNKFKYPAFYLAAVFLRLEAFLVAEVLRTLLKPPEADTSPV